MSKRRPNSQLFALAAPPAGEIRVAGTDYRLQRVFKHDFFAATCLYQGGDEAKFPRIVVKLFRSQGLYGLSARWFGRASRNHELSIYAALDGVDGVPHCLGPLGETGLAIEYIDALPLDHFEKPPAGFFDRLGEIIQAVHARGVAYIDANKRSNILVGPDGKPHLIDYQISLRRRDDWPWPLRWLSGRVISYFQGKDLYHFSKHKRRLAPDELTAAEDALSRRRSGLHWLHRKLTKPYRAVRRRFLSKRHRSGQLVSPTADLEDHYQPEKATWRKTGKD